MMIQNLLGKVAEGGEYEDAHCQEEHKKTQLLTFSLVNDDNDDDDNDGDDDDDDDGDDGDEERKKTHFLTLLFTQMDQE